MVQFRIAHMMVNYERMSAIIQKTRFHTLKHVAKNKRFDFPAVTKTRQENPHPLGLG